MKLPGGDNCHTNMFTKWLGTAQSILTYAEAQGVTEIWMKELGIDADEVKNLSDGKN